MLISTKYYFQLFILLLPIWSLGQNQLDTTFTLVGKVTSQGEPLIGQTVREHQTANYVLTNIDGEFKIALSEHKPTLIYLPFCFNQIYRLVTPETKSVVIEIDSKQSKRKSKKAFRRWKRMNKL